MKMRRRDQDPASINENIEHNRISGIEMIRKEPLPGSQGKLILALSLAALSIAGILVLTNYIFDKPGSFLSKTAGPETSETEIVTDTGVIKPAETENADLKKAIEDYRGGYRAKAITGFTSVVESAASDRDKGIALLYLGMIADSTGDYKSAIEYFQRALNYDRKNPDIFLSIARTYRNMKNYPGAIKNAESSHELAPESINPLLLLGNIHFEQGNYNEAVKYYDLALNIDKNNPALLYNMAAALLKKGDYFPGLEYLKKAAEADSIGEVAYKSYSRLGAEFLENSNFPLAEKYLKQAVALRPGEPSARYNLALAYLRQNKNSEALKELMESEKLSRGDPDILERIGDSYFALNEYDSSLRSFSKVLESRNRDVKILSRIGEIHYKKGDLDRAYDAYSKVVNLEPATENARIAYLNMGNILDDALKHDDAVKAYESALAIKSNDDLAYYNMGIAYKHGDKPALAINAWNKSAELNPGNIKPRIAIADYYNERGYPDLAEKEYQEILYRWPDNQEAAFKTAAIYHRQKNYRDANKAYKRVTEIDPSNDMARKAYINMAMISSIEDTSEASLNNSMEILRKALIMEPSNPDALLAMGIIYAKKEMHDKAIDTFYQVIRATRDSTIIAESYNNIGKSYYQQKEFKKAIEAFSRGVEENPASEELRINRKTAAQAYENELANTGR